MMLKSLFVKFFLLITSPAQTWKKLREEEIGKEFYLQGFFFPVIGLLCLATFIGTLIYAKELNFGLALREVCLVLLEYVGAFYATTYLLQWLLPRICHVSQRVDIVMQFVGNCSYIFYFTAMVLVLLPKQLSFMRLAPFYVIYIIWQGAEPFLRIPENRKLVFISLSSFLIGLMPVFIRQIILFLMPGMQG